MSDESDPVPEWPIITQADPGRPVFRGLGDTGQDLVCASCGGVLAENIPPYSLLEIALRCATCGTVAPTPSRPPGRGIGGVAHVVEVGHEAVGTFPLDDIVLVGGSAMRSRLLETGSDIPAAEPALLDTDAIRRVIDEARTTFAPILPVAKAPKHRLPRLIETIEENLASLRDGATSVDLFSIFALARATAAFRQWQDDPATEAILWDCKDPYSFEHNVVLLRVATLLHQTGLGPEFVPTGLGRTPDLILRISATRWLQIDTKTPRAIQLPAGGTPIKLVSPRDTISKVLRRMRGQFTGPGIAVIAGDLWIDVTDGRWTGGIDTYAVAAEKLLSEPLPADASQDARTHYQRLVGIMFVSVGWTVEGRTYRDRLHMRWIPNPRYAESVEVSMSRHVDGPFHFHLGRIVDSGEHFVSPSGASVGSPPVDENGEEIFDAARFALTNTGYVVAEGVMSAPGGGTAPTAAFRFPEGYRPTERIEFDVMRDGGFTIVTVEPDGHLLADPSVEWVSLHGVRFKAAASALRRSSRASR
jgi:hypothetical protein